MLAFVSNNYRDFKPSTESALKLGAYVLTGLVFAIMNYLYILFIYFCISRFHSYVFLGKKKTQQGPNLIGVLSLLYTYFFPNLHFYRKDSMKQNFNKTQIFFQYFHCTTLPFTMISFSNYK